MKFPENLTDQQKEHVAKKQAFDNSRQEIRDKDTEIDGLNKEVDDQKERITSLTETNERLISKLGACNNKLKDEAKKFSENQPSLGNNPCKKEKEEIARLKAELAETKGEYERLEKTLKEEQEQVAEQEELVKRTQKRVRQLEKEKEVKELEEYIKELKQYIARKNLKILVILVRREKKESKNLRKS